MGTVRIRGARLLAIAVVMLAVRSAGAVPAFARQTGFACSVCHTIYPELTPIGRRFKLYGYTWTNKEPEATVFDDVQATAAPVWPADVVAAFDELARADELRTAADEKLAAAELAMVQLAASDTPAARARASAKIHDAATLAAFEADLTAKTAAEHAVDTASALAHAAVAASVSARQELDKMRTQNAAALGNAASAAATASVHERAALDERAKRLRDVTTAWQKVSNAYSDVAINVAKAARARADAADAVVAAAELQAASYAHLFARVEAAAIVATAPPPSSGIRLWLSRFPPIAFVFWASMTAWNRQPVAVDAAGNMRPVQEPLYLFPQLVSLVYAGRISDASGLWAQLTYDQTVAGVRVDTIDLRYIIDSDGDLLDANGRRADVLVGMTFNNGPTSADVWATGGASAGGASAFGLPNFPIASQLAKPQSPLVYNLAQKSAAIGVYTFIHDAFYAELSGYVAAQPGVLRISSDPATLTSSGGAIEYVAPYWRFGYERNWDHDKRSLMVGTTGMFTPFTQPGATTLLPAASYLDVGLDAQYQIIEPRHILTLHGSWMHEQSSNTTALVGTEFSNARDRLDRVSLASRYFYDRTYGALVGYVDVGGTNDVLANCGALAACNGSPAARWLTFEAYWMARLNVQLFVHYDAFLKLDSAANAFAALPNPKASDNDLFLAGIWFAF